MKALTHVADSEDVDHEEMSLVGMDDKSAIVCFDGDTEDTARMPQPVYDMLVEGGEWESIGFKEL